jgi:glycosyltransferase involved in cell wall biosynthesis
LNGGRFLEPALNSVLAQDYPNVEVIFSDDGSTDSTLDITDAFLKNTRVPARLYHHTCRGIGANWNHCVSQARGKYIKFLMQDDLLLERCISKMVHAAESNSSIGLVYCRRTVLLSGNIDGLGEWLRVCGSLHDKLAMAITHGLINGREILRDNKFIEPPRNKIGEPTAVLYPIHLIKDIGIFREDLTQTLDYEYWYRILKKYDAFFIDEELARFRRHEKQATTINNQDIKENTYEMAKLWGAYVKNLFFQLSPRNRRILVKLWTRDLMSLFIARAQRLVSVR